MARREDSGGMPAISTGAQNQPRIRSSNRDVGFAIGIVAILVVLFLPIPPFLLDMGLALSISLSVVILMVALWIPRPLDFSAFPTVLLIATMLRLALNVATTRLILSHGHEGPTAAGHMVGGFSKLVMSGDFVIGIIVFLILITINLIINVIMVMIITDNVTVTMI
jgi:flagellar biosynthesis protein FlhA